jgi:serine/threonine protein kinase
MVQPVGEGTFKRTFHARAGDGTSLALKIYKPVDSTIAKYVSRELEALSTCAHRSIVKVRECSLYEHQGTEFLYTLEDYCSGGTLTERLAAGPLPLSEAIALGSELIPALAHLRGKGLVHRDIKPDNIMFRTRANGAVLVDLGLVRVIDAASITGTWLPQGPGTPLFASPEQLSNEKDLIDWRSDQFSLGVSVAISVLGRHPFAEAGDSDTTVVARVAEKSPLPQGTVSDLASIRLGPVVRMLSPYPVQRFRTPDHLLESWGKIGASQ